MKLVSITVVPYSYKEGMYGRACFSDDGADMSINLDSHQCQKIVAFAMEGVISATRKIAKQMPIQVEVALQAVISGEIAPKPTDTEIPF